MRTTFDGSTEGHMHRLTRWLGATAASLILISLGPWVDSTARVYGLHVDYTFGWRGALLFVIVTSALLLLWFRFGFWRLSSGRPGATLLAAAFICTGIWALLLLTPLSGGVALPVPLLFANNWLGLLAGLLFACGLLVSDLLPRWVARLGIASVVLTAGSDVRTTFVLGASTSVQMIGWRLHDAGYLLDLTFLVAVAVICLLPGTGLASNKRIEPTARAPYDAKSASSKA
jgi:hypothetical protein